MDALAKATYYLNVKPRTKAQVIKYLTEKGYASAEIDVAVASLEEYKYIDDENFTRLYLELGFEKGHGIARIRRELAGKGINREIIDATVDILEEQEKVPNQYEMALEIGQKIITEHYMSSDLCTREDSESLDYNEKVKLQAKIARRLATRGFSGEIAYRVAKEVVQ